MLLQDVEEEEEEDEGMVEGGMNGRKARDVLFFLETTCKVIGTNTHTHTDRDTSDAGVRCFVCVWSVWSVWMSSRGCLAARQALLLLLLMGAAAHTHTQREQWDVPSKQASKQAK